MLQYYKEKILPKASDLYEVLLNNTATGAFKANGYDKCMAPHQGNLAVLSIETAECVEP